MTRHAKLVFVSISQYIKRASFSESRYPIYGRRKIKAYQFCFIGTRAEVSNSICLRTIVHPTVRNSIRTALPLPPLNYSPSAQSHSQKRKRRTNADTYSQDRRIVRYIFTLRLGRSLGRGLGRSRSNGSWRRRSTCAGRANQRTTNNGFPLELVIGDPKEGGVASLGSVADVAVSAPELGWPFVSPTRAGPDVGPGIR